MERWNVGTFERSNVQTPDDTLWALKDVSFEVQRGEGVGVIGRRMLRSGIPYGQGGVDALMPWMKRTFEPKYGIMKDNENVELVT